MRLALGKSPHKKFNPGCHTGKLSEDKVASCRDTWVTYLQANLPSVKIVDLAQYQFVKVDGVQPIADGGEEVAILIVSRCMPVAFCIMCLVIELCNISMGWAGRSLLSDFGGCALAWCGSVLCVWWSVVCRLCVHVCVHVRVCVCESVCECVCVCV